MVYLFRSIGAVWGVAAVSTIIQNILTARLPEALSGIPDKEKVIFLSYAPLMHCHPILPSLPP